MGSPDGWRQNVRRGSYYDSGWIAGRPPARGRSRDVRLALVAVGLACVVLVVGVGASHVAADPVVERLPRSTVQTAGRLPRLEPAECRFETLGDRTVDCSDLIVPERRGVPDSAVVRLHVAVFHSDAREPEPDPVVYLEGGPGAQALHDWHGFSDLPFLERRDLVVFDQRGTGHSMPSLDCPEVADVATYLLQAFFDEGIGMRRCRDRLIGQGVDLGGYDSRENAADLLDLRRALGIRSWNLYGISYGTRLALTAMRDHRDGIRSVILDSVYPPQADSYGEAALNASRAFTELFRACRERPSCEAAHPDLKETFHRLLERLDADPVSIDGFDVTSEVVVGYLFHQLYVRDELPALPAAIDAIADGQVSVLRPFVGEIGWMAFDSPVHSWFAEGMHTAVECAEEIPFTGPAAYEAASEGIRREVVDHFDPALVRSTCEEWQLPAPDPIENEPVTSDIPTLLLAGRFDPVTPAAWASDTAEHLGNGQVLVFGGSGHGVLPGSACAASQVERFLERPMRAVDGTCAEAEDVDFE